MLILLALVGATVVNLRLASTFQKQDDFAPRWVAAREWLRSGASPYSDSTYQATLDLLDESGNQPSSLNEGRFLDPAWYVFIYMPISFVPYPIARAIWMTLVELCLALSVHFSVRISGLKLSLPETLILSLLILIFYPLFKSVITVSVTVPYFFLTILAVYLATNRQGTMAGFLFALALWMVPLTIFLVILFMIWFGVRRDNSLANVFVSVLGFFVVISLILFPGWAADCSGTTCRCS